MQDHNHYQFWIEKQDKMAIRAHKTADMSNRLFNETGCTHRTIDEMRISHALPLCFSRADNEVYQREVSSETAYTIYHSRKSIPDGERFLQALNGRFLCFTSKAVPVWPNL